MVLLVALPVYAWFTHKRSIALTTKINAPTQLYITAGNKESVANLEMADIDVENDSYKDFVFGIGGADVQQYQIQLAHTTNIPFEYEIYRAKSVSETEKSEAVVYVSDEENKTFYYKIDGNKISGHYLNQQGSVIDNKDPFCDYFIIRVKWNDKVQNNKETDMVYLTVQRK